jgi:hypothetical protein
MMKLVPGANYYEIIIADKKEVLTDIITKFNVGISEKQFYDIMYKIDGKKYKYFQREYKEYFNKDLVCQCFLNDDVKVHRKVPINIDENIQNNIIVAYNKNKLTLVNFPSTKNLHKISYVKKMIFRVSNRIYINFKISIDSETKNKNYVIYVNYNHDDNIDFNIISRNIKEILDML